MLLCEKGEETMRFHISTDYMLNNISKMKKRLWSVCRWWLIAIMVETRKHSLTFASELSGTSESAFSKFLMNNKKVKKYGVIICNPLMFLMIKIF